MPILRSLINRSLGGGAGARAHSRPAPMVGTSRCDVPARVRQRAERMAFGVRVSTLVAPLLNVVLDSAARRPCLILGAVRGCVPFLLALLLAAGCQTEPPQPAGANSNQPASTPMLTTPAKVTSTRIAEPLRAPIRIKAGTALPIKDSEGNTWLADKGFSDGDTIERPDLKIANTTTPAIYWAERYEMTSFSWPLANGPYIVKLHFAETYEGITGPGQRVFSFNVAGHEFKDFDVCGSRLADHCARMLKLFL